MSMRTRFRNWLLKPSAAEAANDGGQGSRYAELIWSPVQLELTRNLSAKYPGGEVVGSSPGMVAIEQPGATTVDLADATEGVRP